MIAFFKQMQGDLLCHAVVESADKDKVVMPSKAWGKPNAMEKERTTVKFALRYKAKVAIMDRQDCNQNK